MPVKKREDEPREEPEAPAAAEPQPVAVHTNEQELLAAIRMFAIDRVQLEDIAVVARTHMQQCPTRDRPRCIREMDAARGRIESALPLIVDMYYRAKVEADRAERG